jgi:hypothetical protein
MMLTARRRITWSPTCLCVRRTDDGWELAFVSGGTDWPGVAPAGVPVADDYVGFDDDRVQTVHEENWSCTAVDGRVGKQAAWIELIEADGPVRHRIDSPIGAVVVAISQHRPAVIRVLIQDGREIGGTTLY